VKEKRKLKRQQEAIKRKVEEVEEQNNNNPEIKETTQIEISDKDILDRPIKIQRIYGTTISKDELIKVEHKPFTIVEEKRLELIDTIKKKIKYTI